MTTLLTHADEDEELFEGGPPRRLETLLGLARKNRPNVLRFEIFVVCVGWLPLLLLVTGQTLTAHDGSLVSFISDYGIQVRSLIAAPLLVLAEAISVPRLSRIAGQFVTNGLITTADEGAFKRIVLSTRQLRDSLSIEIAIVLISLALGAVLVFFVPLKMMPGWSNQLSPYDARLSPAGWWNDLVTAPILLLLVFGWIWRLGLWARFLLLVSRLNLRLVATHPDHVGGLGFLEISVQVFSLLGFCFATILAGFMANQVMHESATIANFRYAIGGFAIVMVVVVAGPLLAFTDRIVAAWREGVFVYGALAHAMGARMEQKWLSRPLRDDALEANDFSATTDLFSVVANVYATKVLPLSLVRLGVFVMATLLPFLPVVLISIPLSFIMKKVVGVLL